MALRQKRLGDQDSYVNGAPGVCNMAALLLGTYQVGSAG